MKTVLITGASSGFGEAVALRFAKVGWNVVATMRDPSAAGPELGSWPNLLATRLDVQDRQTIASAIEEGIQRFGGIDVVVNNAGYGLFGIFEGVSREAIHAQFDVNVFGAMDVVRAILPHFRSKGSGMIVNVSSGAGAIGFPMASIYSASKFALEGWSEGLSYELDSIGIKVKIVEPGGATRTNFMQRTGAESGRQQPIEDYAPFLRSIGTLYEGMGSSADPDAVEKVAAAIFTAATDGSNQLRYSPTDDIQPILNARRSSSEQAYRSLTLGIFTPKAA
ncbi:SDR family oxidoreductase [Variovorax jilinensis]|uniref:SDR family oxidoreductase n=1 Tax=Variovorax jilinensis TaxID=3053513 RepID=UPI002575C3AD|nr:SDR family oxidoreductase [Variovorax sp. J22P168]